jgi:CO/xanthine dehydrogenase Mo-binding subunit
VAEKQVIGVPTPRVEAEEKVSGRAIYAVDVVLPGMLWAKVLRSPIPYGRIKKIDVSKASRLSGVKAVVTGDEVKGIRMGKKIVDTPILGQEVVRFAGEKVAAVAAESEEIAERALEQIDVEYEELEALLDPIEAMSPSAQPIHPDVTGYGGLLHKLEKPSNVFVQLSWKKGDVEEGFRGSDLIVENSFRTSISHQAYLEPHCCVVKAHNSGQGEIWATIKTPYALRDQLAAAFKVSPQTFVIHPSYIGGDFGGKGDGNDIALCYILSKISGHPVKLVMEYSEELMAGNPRHAAVIRVKTGVKKEGVMVAQQVQFIFDSGAYGGYRPQGYLVGAHEAVGPYRIPHVLIEESYVYTNKVPCGYVRAPGFPQGFFATESQMDLVAKKLGLDPAKFRMLNFMHEGDESPMGHRIDHIKSEETFKKALEVSGYSARKPRNVGRGCAIAQWQSKGGESYTYITIDDQGAVTLSTALADVGPGAYTIMRQIVSEELKIPLETVTVHVVDTAKIVKDTGVRGSSSTRVHGGATYDTSKRAKEEILRIASEQMGASPNELVLHEGGVTHARAERRMTFAEIVRANGSAIVAEGHYNNMTDGPEASMVAQVAEVEVDRETGEVKLRQLTTAHNVGTVLNPLMHQGQIDGGIVMGMGYAKMEEMIINESGNVATTNLGDYKLPTIQDIPVLNTAVIQSTSGSGPYNSTSIGETAIMPTAAAIANAVEDAVDARVDTLPITAEKVLQVLKRGMAEGR